MSIGMGNKLQDETNFISGDDWLSKQWFKNTFEIIFWFFVIGGPINMIISEDPIDFGLWATISVILIIIRFIVLKLKNKLKN